VASACLGPAGHVSWPGSGRPVLSLARRLPDSSANRYVA